MLWNDDFTAHFWFNRGADCRDFYVGSYCDSRVV